MSKTPGKTSKPVSEASKPVTENGADRELFVIDDLSSIPANELRPIVGGTGTWLKTVFGRKLSSGKTNPVFAVELRKLKRARHTPKRMEKFFEDLRSRLRKLEFHDNFEATVPAIGPYVSAIVAMSRRDGDIHFFAHRVTIQADSKITDVDDLRYVSWLKDGSLLITSSRKNLPHARNDVDRAIVASSDPAAILREHVERMRGKAIAKVSPSKLFEFAEEENRKEIADWVRRSVVRPATAAELSRIRTKMRV